MAGIPTMQDSPTLPTLTSEAEKWEDEVYGDSPIGGDPHPYSN